MKLKPIICTEEILQETDEVKILPLGFVKTQKGNFIVDIESVNFMRKAFKERKLDIVVDYEHQTLNDVQAPAGGWIKDFYIKDNAVVAKVEWTEKAKEYIANKEYRYLSPVVLVRKTDHKAVILHSVALTNTPAIDGMYTIKNSIDIEDIEGGAEDMDLLQQLIKMLGLAEGTTEEQVLAKLKEIQEASVADPSSQEVIANKETLKLLDLKEDATQEEVTSKIMELKNPVAQGQVSVAEFKALKDKLDRKEAEEVVMFAMKEGKITPAQKEWAEEYALKAPEGFKKYIETASVVVPMGSLDIPPSTKKTVEVDMKACKMLGVSKEDIEKYGKDVE
ncbi:phage protease [Cellulosilyticum sp. I15G10I2]|uniref:phage protease n=1 Tax=Cellulosilyticum sp. I15G10I2 TaxID=1892843 RepID=UPI00085CDB37|nr:phage protease [Cellulosilyticum sp. I15G10I2]